MGESVKKILVVDDDFDLQIIIGKRLRLSGFDCYQALTVEAGLKMLEEIDPDLVILDLGFSGNDGTDFLQTMHQYCRECPPVLVMSCFGEDVIIEFVLTHGADDFVRKPYDPKHLISRIDHILSRKKAETMRDASQNN